MNRISAAIILTCFCLHASVCGGIVFSQWERGFWIWGGPAISGGLMVLGVTLCCWLSYRRHGHILGAKA